MPPRPFKSHASSSRVVPVIGAGFGASSSNGFGAASNISYLAEQPDLTGLSDPHVVVSFKNLQKKDATTRTRGLEDIQSYVDSLRLQSETLEDAFLESWTKVYPRLTIDLARRVRQVAHVVQGKVATMCGKRMVKHLPIVTPSWLSGLHDGDKSVTRSTRDALFHAFPSQEKQLGLRKAYQSECVNYCIDAVVKETPNTLSDERTTTPEDSEAIYARVVSSSMSLVSELVETLDAEDKAKRQTIYAELLSSKELCAKCHASDASVRKAFYTLIALVLHSMPDLVDQNCEQIVSALLSKRATRDQTGSSSEYASCLASLTSHNPSLWISQKSSETSGFKLLQSVFNKGSHRGPATFWANLDEIFNSLPQEVLPPDINASQELLDALYNAATRREEPRTNLKPALQCYFHLFDRCLSSVPAETRINLADSKILPLYQQYVRPDVSKTRFDLPASSALEILQQGLKFSSVISCLESRWNDMSDTLEQDIQTSSPEQSSEFESSQKFVASESTHFLALVCAVTRANSATSSSLAIAEKFITSLANTCTEVLKARHGKPFGAAACLDSILDVETPTKSVPSEVCLASLENFALSDAPGFLSSRSQEHLVSLLYKLHMRKSFPQAWKAYLETILSFPKDQAKTSLVTFVSSSHMPEDIPQALENNSLQQFAISVAEDSIDKGTSQDALAAILRRKPLLLSDDTVVLLFNRVCEALSEHELSSNALSVLNLLQSRRLDAFRKFASSQNGSTLLQRLLLLQESPEPSAASLATQLTQSLESVSKTSVSDDAAGNPSIAVLRRGYAEANHNSLSVEALVELSWRVARGMSPEDIHLVLPDPQVWKEALLPFLSVAVPSSLAITDDLGGAMDLVQDVKENQLSSIDPGYDIEGFSPPLRMALCLVAFAKQANEKELVNILHSETYQMLALTTSLVADKIKAGYANVIWTETDFELEQQMIAFEADAKSLLIGGLPKSNQSHDSSIPAWATRGRLALSQFIIDESPQSYHHARIFCTLTQRQLDQYSLWNSDQAVPAIDIKSIFGEKSFIALASYLRAYCNPNRRRPAYTEILNRCIADLSDLEFSTNVSVAHPNLIIFNLIVDDDEEIMDKIPQMRVVRFIKNLALQFNATLDSSLNAEIAKTFSHALPSVLTMFDSFWESIIRSIIVLIGDQTLPYFTPNNLSLIHSLLKLIATLKQLVRDESANEDLAEAWTSPESQEQLSDSLVQLLLKSSDLDDEYDSPLEVTLELLARVLQSIPKGKLLKDCSNFYALINSKSPSVQQTAFDIIHRQIPGKQEEISVDVALGKSGARLPDELISLLLHSPAEIEDLLSFERRVPPVVFAYLSSWVLVFDHFKKASDKVKYFYASHIREADILGELLVTIFKCLGFERGRPLDVTRFDPTTYSFNIETNPTLDVQWLLVHLYFLCLKRLPSLTKNWYLNCKSRQIKAQVEPWTSKYFSSFLISDALQGVSEWAASQDSTAEDAFNVKTNVRAQEVIASKEIDEQQLKIAIRLPSNFPLGQVTVEGVNRVAVDDRKWRSWLRITEGIIAFSDNSMEEGLLSFKRNLMGQLKGQTECAICYSIVGQDKQLPTKKCGTCSNAFHGSCLYRWFKSSNSSTCPLCRTPFNYVVPTN